jgi:4-hydroxythreonine-4-phosphate dehydrogenase
MTSTSEFDTPLGMTVGDMAGIGPELILRQWEQLLEIHPAVIYADLRWLRDAAASLAAKGIVSDDMAVRLWSVSPGEAFAAIADDAIPVVHCEGEELPGSGGRYPWGQAVSDFGLIQYRAFRRAISDALEDRISGIVTCPWHKSRLLSVGLPATGHTEVIARDCEVDEVVMMLAGDTLRVALATTHIPVTKIAESLSTERLVKQGKIIARGLKDLYGIDDPIVAFCGLNPHAGESGAIGVEEEDIIQPAIGRLQEAGVRATGPYPADTLFPMKVRGRIEADAIFAMYHDQGLAPLKTHHLGQAVNVTLGIPVIRTSVDHGTAYDLAGLGEADAGSLMYAFQTAASFARRRRERRSVASTDEYKAT